MLGRILLNGSMIKIGGFSEGQDCAFVDYIVFPPIDLGTVSLEENFVQILNYSQIQQWEVLKFYFLIIKIILL